MPPTRPGGSQDAAPLPQAWDGPQSTWHTGPPGRVPLLWHPGPGPSGQLWEWPGTSILSPFCWLSSGSTGPWHTSWHTRRAHSGAGVRAVTCLQKTLLDPPRRARAPTLSPRRRGELLAILQGPGQTARAGQLGHLCPLSAAPWHGASWLGSRRGQRVQGCAALGFLGQGGVGASWRRSTWAKGGDGGHLAVRLQVGNSREPPAAPVPDHCCGLWCWEACVQPQRRHASVSARAGSSGAGSSGPGGGRGVGWPGPQGLGARPSCPAVWPLALGAPPPFTSILGPWHCSQAGGGWGTEPCI